MCLYIYINIYIVQNPQGFFQKFSVPPYTSERDNVCVCVCVCVCVVIASWFQSTQRFFRIHAAFLKKNRWSYTVQICIMGVCI